VTTWALKGPGVVWKPYSEEALAAARKLKKPVLIDFYATWCAPCRELEEITFHDAAVVKLAEGEFFMIKVDVTRSGNPTHDRLLQELGIKGVPTVVFLDSEGKERNDLRLVDFIPADQLLTRMNQLLKPAG
jgi:thiol:disulfide interchange protein DsbD